MRVQAVGYIVVTFVFAMEHGGIAAAVDDFYVRPEARGEGLATAALAAVRRACETLGVRAMRVEVGADNAVAQAVYRAAGFKPLPGHGSCGWRWRRRRTRRRRRSFAFARLTCPAAAQPTVARAALAAVASHTYCAIPARIFS